MSEETIPQMRENIDRLEKQVKDLSATNKELGAGNRVLQARDVFRDAGYDAAKGELYAAQNPEGDITAETVNEFVSRYGLAPIKVVEVPSADEGEPNPQTPPPGSSKLADMARSGSRAGEGGVDGSTQAPLTMSDWQQLYAKDPAAAKEAVRRGRVVENSTDVTFGNPYS